MDKQLPVDATAVRACVRAVNDWHANDDNFERELREGTSPALAACRLVAKAAPSKKEG